MADQLAIYKRRREVELGATENNIMISWRSERDLNPRPTDIQIQRSNHSAMLPPVLHHIILSVRLHVC